MREVQHSLFQTILTVLRDRTTDPVLFRDAMHRASLLLASEAYTTLRLKPVAVETPLGVTAKGHAVKTQVVLVPVLRAGLGLLTGFLTLMPSAIVGHIGLQRMGSAHEAYYEKLPKLTPNHHVFVLEPMLATGRSAALALEAIAKQGPAKVTLVSLIATPEALSYLATAAKNVEIIVGKIDPKLNAKHYIEPGLGDAGDRYFGV